MTDVINKTFKILTINANMNVFNVRERFSRLLVTDVCIIGTYHYPDDKVMSLNKPHRLTFK